MTDDGYDPQEDMRRSLRACYEAIRARVAAGGQGWAGMPQKERAAPPAPPSPENRTSGDL